MLPMDEVEAIIERDQSATSGAPQAQRRLAGKGWRWLWGVLQSVAVILSLAVCTHALVQMK